jgi:hypothetical protein
VITVVVEGDTDIPFVDKLCAEVGLEVRLPVIDAAGKGGIDAKLAGYARAANGSPHLVLRDLDNDASCAASWLLANAPQNAGPYFCLRIAVREIEAWFLADAQNAAAKLHVASSAIPHDPDAEADPTATIVALARRSNKPRIKSGLVPAPGTARTVGPDYERWLIESAATWSVKRAIHRSDSLRRARKALARLKVSWDAVLTGGMA